jgi:hypothetical protein
VRSIEWLPHEPLELPAEEAKDAPREMKEDVMVEEAKDAQLVVRLPHALVERIDSYAERLRRETPGPSWTRADVVRLLLSRSLEAAEEPKRRTSRTRSGDA